MIRGIYPIVDASLRPELSEIEISRLITCSKPHQIQLRVKNKEDREFWALAREVRKITKETSTTMIINDRVDITLASGADGVHLGQLDLPADVARGILGEGKIIGVSIRSLPEAEDAVRRGADYVAFGSVYPTRTKESARVAPRALEQLKEIVDRVSVPVVAVGGINRDNIMEVLESGVAGAAIISAIVTAPDISRAVEEFQRIYDQKSGG